MITNNSLTLHSAKAFLAAAPHLSKLKFAPGVTPEHIMQMGRAAFWKRAEQVASFIDACQPSAHLVGPLASIHHPTLPD